MDNIRWLFKFIRYSLFLEYHMKKKDTISSKHQTVLKYHFEMTEHYYEKIYGKGNI
jgi:hypothetical protein